MWQARETTACNFSDFKSFMWIVGGGKLIIRKKPIYLLPNKW